MDIPNRNIWVVLQMFSRIANSCWTRSGDAAQNLSTNCRFCRLLFFRFFSKMWRSICINVHPSIKWSSSYQVYCPCYWSLPGPLDVSILRGRASEAQGGINRSSAFAFAWPLYSALEGITARTISLIYKALRQTLYIYILCKYVILYVRYPIPYVKYVTLCVLLYYT